MNSKLLDEYLGGADLLRQAVAGLDRRQALARPITGKWSTLEVVCHLADMDAVFAERMKRVIAEDRPTFFDADADLFARGLAYHDRDLDEEVAQLDFTRRQMARILRSLPAEAWQRAGTHSTAGPLTLEQLLGKVTRHLAHHLGFIHEKRKALGA